MSKLVLVALVLIGGCAGDGDPRRGAPDAGELQTCADLGCPTVSQNDRVCATTGKCTCDPDGRGPEEPIACKP